MSEPLPTVNRDEFERITCNRCGACCESLFMDEASVKAAKDGTLTFTDNGATVAWLKALVPNNDAPRVKGRRARWRCTFFERDGAGLGVCTNYENRPAACRNFPYREPVIEPEDWRACSWAVRVIDPWQIEH